MAGSRASACGFFIVIMCVAASLCDATLASFTAPSFAVVKLNSGCCDRHHRQPRHHRAAAAGKIVLSACRAAIMRYGSVGVVGDDAACEPHARLPHRFELENLVMTRAMCLTLVVASLAAAPGCSSCFGGSSCRRPSFMEFRSCGSPAPVAAPCAAPAPACAPACEPACGPACESAAPCCEGGMGAPMGGAPIMGQPGTFS